MLLQQGRYGPYVRHRQESATVPKHIHPSEITLEKAILILKDVENRKA
ncbi:MAG: hypothetical protein H7175_17110 [Burkholderiales bacterium]|nr:hypothetical protein [Anaerolineae bacterium]